VIDFTILPRTVINKSKLSSIIVIRFQPTLYFVGYNCINFAVFF